MHSSLTGLLRQQMARKDLKELCRNIHRAEGDAIEGDSVIAQCRDTGKTRVRPGTSTHKIQETILRSNVLCVIDKAFRLRGTPFRSSGT
jgi:hypothetical protein